jgi:outer membrane immunogenic protein
LGGGLNQSSAWNVGARAGVLVTPSLLTYFDGGFTQARFGQTNLSTFGAPVQVPSPFALSANNFNGWFIGGGTEYAVTWLPIPGIFWRNEYRYSTYNSADVPVITAATGAATAFGQHMQPQVQTITTSLVWRFNFLNH